VPWPSTRTRIVGGDRRCHFLNMVRLTTSVSSRRGDDLPGVDPAKGARLLTSEDDAGLVRSFCTALKPPASPTIGRQSGGHAASGRSHPPPPTKKPVEQPTHEAMDPLIKKSQPTGHNFRNLD
jgi:hypothetical protein